MLFLSFSQNSDITNDSINSFVQKVSDKSLSLNERVKFNNRIYTSTKNDSLIDFALSRYVYFYYKLNDSLNFQKYTQKHLNHAQKRNDEKAIAKILEYKAAFFKKDNAVDSTFYYYHKSFKAYEKIHDSLGAGKILMNTTILQKNIHDYIGSESTSLKALEFLEGTKNKRRISSVYNNLGIVYSNLEMHNESIKFHTKALNLRREIKSKLIYQVQSLNNIAKAYKNNGNYQKSIEYLNRALEHDSLLDENLITKSVLIDNLAHARFKKNKHADVFNDFHTALSIRKEIDDKNGIVMSYLHLAEYHQSKNEIDKAISYAQQAESIAIQTKKYRDYLAALKLTGQLYNGDKVKEKYEKYIAIRDSLDLIARRQKEQFASIQLGLNEKDLQIESVKKSDKEKYYWILILLAIIAICVYAYYVLYKKRRRQQIEYEELVTKFNKSSKKLFHSQDSEQNTKFREEFHAELIKKYNLTEVLIEFWELQIQGLSEFDIAKELKSVTEGAIKKRRNKLYKKLKAYYGSLNKIDKFISISIYNNAFQEFKKQKEVQYKN